MNPKSDKLIALKAQRDAVKSDYKNPQRAKILSDYHSELEACGRRYFDDRLEAWARDHGMLYGEDTMLDMIADGTFDLDQLNASIQRHCNEILARDGPRASVITYKRISQIVDALGKVQEFNNPALALHCYYAMPRGVRLAFRAAGDARPVYPWDLVDKP